MDSSSCLKARIFSGGTMITQTIKIPQVVEDYMDHPMLNPLGLWRLDCLSSESRQQACGVLWATSALQGSFVLQTKST